MPLNTAPNLADPDGFYEDLITAQRDLSDDEATAMNCRLIILLANHIGDRATLAEALALASPRRHPAEPDRQAPAV